MADSFDKYDKNKVPVAVEIHDQKVWVTLADGRSIGTPLAWYPWLEDAAPEAQEKFTLRTFSVDWDDLDEGIDIEWLLVGPFPDENYAQPPALRVANS